MHAPSYSYMSDNQDVIGGSMVSPLKTFHYSRLLHLRKRSQSVHVMFSNDSRCMSLYLELMFEPALGFEVQVELSFQRTLSSLDIC